MEVPFAEPIGKNHPNVRHDQGFYVDGSNSGYFKEGGVRADGQEHLHKYNAYPPQQGEMCRKADLMKQAEKNVASQFRKDNYVLVNNPITGEKSHNCHDYKKAVNNEYGKLVQEHGF